MTDAEQSATPTGFHYTVSFGGGVGPDGWDSQESIYAIDIFDAVSQARRFEEDGAWVFEVSQNDYPTDQQKTIARLQRELATLTQQLADEKSKRGEAEKELQNIREQEDAWSKVTAKCNHLPRLVIDTEDGQKCCECWAIEERDRADAYEKTEPIKKAEHAYVTGIVHAAHKALELPGDRTFGQIVEPIRQLKFDLARAIAERDEARKEVESLKAITSKIQHILDWLNDW